MYDITNYTALPLILQDVVNATSLKLGTTVNFLAGSAETVAAAVQVLSQNKTVQYPVIQLLYSEKPPTFKYSKETLSRNATFDLIFAVDTENKYQFSERYTINIIPVVYPLIKEFFDQLSRSKLIIPPPEFEFTENEYPYIIDFGAKRVDAIALTDIKLSIKKINC